MRQSSLVDRHGVREPFGVAFDGRAGLGQVALVGVLRVTVNLAVVDPGAVAEVAQIGEQVRDVGEDASGVGVAFAVAVGPDREHALSLVGARLVLIVEVVLRVGAVLHHTRSGRK
jgi:hypothetical protein